MTPQGKRRIGMFFGALVAGGGYAAAAVKLPIVLGLPTAWVEIACQVLIGLGSGLFGAGVVKLGLVCCDNRQSRSLDLSHEILVELTHEKGSENIASSYAFISRIVNITAASPKKDHAIYYNALMTKFYEAQTASNSTVMQQCCDEAEAKVSLWMGNVLNEEDYLSALIIAGYKYKQLPTVLCTPVMNEGDEDSDDDMDTVVTDFSIRIKEESKNFRGNSYIHLTMPKK